MRLNNRLQISLSDKTLNDICFAPQPGNGLTQLLTQFLQTMTAEVAHLDILQVVPHTFIRIQVGRITRQSFQVNPFA